MDLLIYALAFVCLYIGLLYPALAFFGHDVYSRKNKTLTTIIRWRKRGHDFWDNRFAKNILQIVSPLIPLSEKNEKKLNEMLERADLPYNAKEYYAKAILSALSGVFVVLLAAAMDSALLIIGGILLGVWMYFKNMDQVKDLLKSKYALIEGEIPKFIRSVETGLRSEKDIIRVMERYNKVASPVLRSELEVLISDMKSSSISQGLKRFEARMNSLEISRLVAALIEVDRGADASASLQYLAMDMTTMHRQLIQRELDKRPGQMKRAILPAGIVLVVMMFYILIQAVLSSSSSLF